MELQLTTGCVEVPENHDARENSKSQRWLKSVLTPTISILENMGWGGGTCHVLFTDEELPAHPESHAAPRISRMDSTVYFTWTGRRPVLRILNSLMNIRRDAPYPMPGRRMKGPGHCTRAPEENLVGRISDS